MVNNMIKQCFILALLIASQFCIAKTITVSHPMGETTVQSKPERVVVLGMDSLDVLNALAIEPIGVVKSPMPSYLEQYQQDKYVSVGSLFEPDFETIYSLKPDLIIVSNRSSESFEELSKIAPTVLFMADAVNYWQTSKEAWHMLGRIFGKEKQVDSIIMSQEQQIAELHRKATSNNANALVVMKSGDNLSVFGAESRYSSVFSLFGFKESKHDSKKNRHGNLISFEYIAEVDPQYMLVLDRDAAISKGAALAKDKFDNPFINQLSVYKNRNIQYLNSAAWYLAASGIQATQIMIDDIESLLN